VDKAIEMKRYGFLIALLAACVSPGCRAQTDTTSIEPVRFEDGAVALEGEAERLAESWKEARENPGHTLWGRIYREDGEQSLAVDYSKQQVIGDEGLEALVGQDKLILETTVEKEDSLFRLSHLNAFIRLELAGLPAGTAVGHVDLVPVEGMWPEIAGYGGKGDWTVTRSTVCRKLPGAPVPETETLVYWLAMAPQDLSGIPLAVVVHADDGRTWSTRLQGCDLKNGTAYHWKGTCLSPEAPDSGLTATALPQTAMTEVEPGEYSGIAWLSGNQFAVVDDNLKGGGILHFTIPIDDYGSVGSVSMRPANGTAEADGKKRDTEGIAFVPSKNILFTTSEKNQDILGYDLAGYRTGDFLDIPADLKAIQNNRGFESLTFNAATNLFWTTTEAPLRRDTFLPRLLRLQSFDIDGKPAGRFFYQTDEPTRSSAGTVAYVFGVPAMTALDDGRLLVMEREVFVPKGNLWEKLQNSFTSINIYLVDPVRDTAGILRKSLLCSFTTGALDLANFEGMCLGPTLPGGRRCLVLIADSQKGSGGLTQEYVKVVLLQ